MEALGGVGAGGLVGCMLRGPWLAVTVMGLGDNHAAWTLLTPFLHVACVCREKQRQLDTERMRMLESMQKQLRGGSAGGVSSPRGAIAAAAAAAGSSGAQEAAGEGAGPSGMEVDEKPPAPATAPAPGAESGEAQAPGTGAPEPATAAAASSAEQPQGSTQAGDGEAGEAKAQQGGAEPMQAEGAGAAAPSSAGASGPEVKAEPASEPASAAEKAQAEDDAAAAAALLGFGAPGEAAPGGPGSMGPQPPAASVTLPPGLSSLLGSFGAAAGPGAPQLVLAGMAGLPGAPGGVPGVVDPTAGGAPPPPPEDPNEPEYLVKWLHKSHVHNEWVKEGLLSTFARRKLLNFKKQYGDAPVSFMRPEWLLPERFLTRRPSPAGPGWEVLVKWTGLGYDQATWESEGQGVLILPEYLGLHQEMWARQAKAIARVSQPALQAAAAARAAASSGLQELAAQPGFVKGAPLYPHQLATVNWLRRAWAKGRHAVLADEMGLGKTATVITFLQCLL